MKLRIKIIHHEDIGRRFWYAFLTNGAERFLGPMSIPIHEVIEAALGYEEEMQRCL